MRTILAILVFSVLPLGAYNVDSLPLNQWVEIKPGIKFSSEYTTGQHNYQSRSWTKMTYNSADKKLYFYDGYMNSAYKIPQTIYANTLYEADFLTDTIRTVVVSNWRRDTVRSQTNPDSLITYWYNPDSTTHPKPFDRHTYGCFVYADYTNSIYIANGASGGNSARVQDCWRYSFDENRWIFVDSVVRHMPCCNTQFENHLMYIPGSSKLYETIRCQSGRLCVWELNLDTHVWTKREQNIQYPNDLWGAMGTADTKRNRYVFYAGKVGGVASNELNVYYPDEHRFEKLVPVSETLPGGATYPYFAYDSKNDVYLLHGNTIGTWVYKPVTNEWERITTSRNPANNRLMSYNADKDVFVAWDAAGRSMWLFRYGNSGVAGEKAGMEKELKLSVLPNPFNPSAEIRIDGVDSKDIVRAELFDANGRRVINSVSAVSMGKGSKRLEISGLSAGTYIVRVTAGNRTINKMVICLK